MYSCLAEGVKLVHDVVMWLHGEAQREFERASVSTTARLEARHNYGEVGHNNDHSDIPNQHHELPGA